MKVGDYVRTKDGIKKVLKYTYNEKYENGHCVWFDNKDYGILYTDEEVNKMKPSPDIIDLIQEGDYINGYKVAEVSKNGVSYMEETEGQLYDIGNIKSIVTKEQFESMQYEVK